MNRCGESFNLTPKVVLEPFAIDKPTYLGRRVFHHNCSICPDFLGCKKATPLGL